MDSPLTRDVRVSLKGTVACLGGRRLLNRVIAFKMRLQFEHEPGM